MAGNEKVFISHTHEDNELCEPLLWALRTWDADVWFDTASAAVGTKLLDEILHALLERDILIRICTPAAAHSVWMQRELGMFLAFQHVNAQPRNTATGKLISICFAGYEPDPLDRSYLFIDAAGQPQAAWLDTLRRTLDKPMGWVVFDRDDRDYLWWVKKYSQGYVVSAGRRPQPNWLTLHRATCGHVVGKMTPGGYCERDTIKICALDRADLERWAQQQVGNNAHLSAGCNCIVYG